MKLKSGVKPRRPRAVGPPPRFILRPASAHAAFFLSGFRGYGDAFASLFVEGSAGPALPFRHDALAPGAELRSKAGLRIRTAAEIAERSARRSPPPMRATKLGFGYAGVSGERANDWIRRQVCHDPV